MSDYAGLLARLLPPVSYDPSGEVLSAELSAEGSLFQDVEDSAAVVLGAITPWFAGPLLPDWERVLGLTPSVDATLQQRIAQAVAKINESGGLSIPYFVSIAAALGYAITIDEPQPFRVDESCVGDTLYIEDIIFVWEVIVTGSPSITYYFRVGESAVGESLLTFGDIDLESMFNDLKPAWSFVYFSYQG